MADLVVCGADLVATVDDERREIPGGWVAITDGLVSGVGGAERPTSRGADGAATPTGCLVTPGLDQHPPPHLPEPHPRLPARDGGIALRLAHHAVPALEPPRRGGRVRVGVDRPGRARPRRVHDVDRPPLRAPARRRRPDHAPRSAPRSELGMRFHPTRGSMSLSQKDGGLPPDSVVQDDDEILADSRAAGRRCTTTRRSGRDGARSRSRRARRSR